MQKSKQITVNGYTFRVVSTIGDDDCYRLYYGNVPVLDDTANEDFYGDINEVADVMSEMIREETEKPEPWFTLVGAKAFVKRNPLNEKKKAGTAFATGRPATGRNHPVTFRISAEALAILSIVPNKSEFVNDLIINSKQKKHGE